MLTALPTGGISCHLSHKAFAAALLLFSLRISLSWQILRFTSLFSLCLPSGSYRGSGSGHWHNRDCFWLCVQDQEGHVSYCWAAVQRISHQADGDAPKHQPQLCSLHHSKSRKEGLCSSPLLQFFLFVSVGFIHAVLIFSLKSEARLWKAFHTDQIWFGRPDQVGDVPPCPVARKLELDGL